MQNFLAGKKLFFFLLLCSLIFALPCAAKTKALLYIPLDTRPVCLKYPVEAIEAAGYKVLTPPSALISSRYRAGDPDQLWQWLLQSAKTADAAIIAADSLIYGGLVPSRTHQLPMETILHRINRLKELKSSYPKLKLYCFSTLLRTPRKSFGGVEPPYYEEYGPDFFRLGELMDKVEIYGYNLLDQTEIKNLTELMPEQFYNDWFERRQKNLDGHFQLANLVREKYFHYYAVGKDDNAPLSQTHRETRRLVEKTSDISNARFQILPGVDQLGLLLAVRALNEDKWQQPSVYPVYAEGAGAKTIPLYSDQSVGESVNQQILAAGCLPSSSLAEADLVFFVNTPPDGITRESVNPENQPFASQENKVSVLALKELITLGKPLALADVSYANGADNGFMQELYNHSLIPLLSSYSGWNTADNSIGSALSLGLISRNVTAPAKEKFLRIRLADDWYYQSNIRPILKKSLNHGNQYALDGQRRALSLLMQKEFRRLDNRYPTLGITVIAADFPWNRLFEISIDIK